MKIIFMVTRQQIKTKQKQKKIFFFENHIFKTFSDEICILITMISIFARTKLQRILKSPSFPRLSLTKEFVNLNKIQTKHKPGLEKKWNSNYEERDKILTIPNLLCMGRIVVSPYLATIIINGDYKTSLIVYSIAGFTDLVRHVLYILE